MRSNHKSRHVPDGQKSCHLTPPLAARKVPRGENFNEWHTEHEKHAHNRKLQFSVLVTQPEWAVVPEMAGMSLIATPVNEQMSRSPRIPPPNISRSPSK